MNLIPAISINKAATHKPVRRLQYIMLATISLTLTACGEGSGSNSCLDNGSCYTVGGILSGLLPGSQIVLQNNGGNNLTLSNDGDFLFSSTVENSQNFAVTILNLPVGQTCSVDGVNESEVGPADNNVSVTCLPNTHVLSGTLTGLSPGSTITLQNEGADSLTLGANGNFTFPTTVNYADDYAVTVSAFPANTAQSCSITNDAGIVPDTDITNVIVACQ